MTIMSSRATAPGRAFRCFLALLGCALVLPCVAQTPGAMGRTADPSKIGGTAGAGAVQTGPGGASGARLTVFATLVQCVTAVTPAERSATFAGEMTAIGGTAQMEMRIDVLERMPGEALFHTVSAPGLGVWRGSAPGVKVYKYLKQVTNLSAPALYRGAVRFRWLNAKDRLMKAMELRTRGCEQPAAPFSATSTGGTTSSSTAG